MKNEIKIGYCLKDRELASELKGVDVAVFPNTFFGELNFKSELSGKTDCLTEMGRLSSKLDAVCFFGVATDSYGLKRQSVVACCGGRLLGISDANRAYSKGQSASFGYKVYSTEKGRFGVLAGEDLCIANAVSSLSSCDCDAIIDISRDFSDFRADSLIQTLSYLNGIAIIFMAGNKLYASTPFGELKYQANNAFDSFLISTKRKYTEFIGKSRGV